MHTKKVVKIEPKMVSITSTIAVPSANIIMLHIEAHPDRSKAPTWLGHVTTVNPVNGAETKIDLVFEDGEIAAQWRANLIDNMNTSFEEITE